MKQQSKVQENKKLTTLNNATTCCNITYGVALLAAPTFVSSSESSKWISFHADDPSSGFFLLSLYAHMFTLESCEMEKGSPYLLKGLSLFLFYFSKPFKPKAQSGKHHQHIVSPYPSPLRDILTKLTSPYPWSFLNHNLCSFDCLWWWVIATATVDSWTLKFDCSLPIGDSFSNVVGSFRFYSEFSIATSTFLVGVGIWMG